MSNYIDPRHKVLRHLDKLHQLAHYGNTSAPVNVEIDASNVCSLGCSWCHFGYTHTRGPLAGKHAKPDGAIDGGHMLDWTLAQRILTQLAGCGVKSVTWTGGGEPTLNPHFDEMVRHAAAVGLEQGLYTHGGHIDAKRAALLKSTLTWVYVSLDECTPDAYQRGKGVNRFRQATDGIRRLVAAEGTATVGVGFLLHPDNFRQVPAMVELGRLLGVDYMQFRPRVTYSQDAPNQLAEDTQWVWRAIAQLAPYADDPDVVMDTDRFAMYRDWQGHGYTTCHWSALQTVITPNGKVWRCVNKREHPDALLGDLVQEDFASLWARAGGACTVNAACRLMCRGHISNLTLDGILASTPHANFI